MKRSNFGLLMILLLLTSITTLNAQTTITEIGALQDKDFTFGWVNYTPQKTEYPAADFELVGSITEDLTLYNTNTYLIKGNVYIEPGVTVRIFPGTVLRGDADTKGTLIVTNGGKLIANGTSTDPVVFTSNKSEGGREAGNWGGIIILGNAPINKIGGISKLEGDLDHNKMLFGGDDENHNGGTLKYVRVEFAGIKSKEAPMASITLAGVGVNTQLDYVQVTNSKTDGFTFIGGRVNPDGLVSHYNIGDDYHFSDGYKGYMKNSISVRHPLISDISGSSAFNVSGHSGEDEFDANKGNTDVIISKPTLVKMRSTGINNPAAALSISESSRIKLEGALIVGFDQGVVFKEAGVLRRIQDEQVQIADSYISTIKDSFIAGDNEEVVSEWYENPKFHNKFINGKQQDWSLFRNAESKGKLDLRLDPETIKSVVGF